MAKKKLTQRARQLRNNPTEAEKVLWFYLRNREAMGVKFTRQHPVGNHIVDLACRSMRIAIECDGGQHSAEGDAARTRLIEAHGYRVLRFWNHDISDNAEGVLKAISHEIEIARNQ